MCFNSRALCKGFQLNRHHEIINVEITKKLEFMQDVVKFGSS